MEKKQNILDLSFESLKLFLLEKINIKEEKINMRAQQIFAAVYQKGIKNFDSLTTLPLELRKKLNESFFLIIQKLLKNLHL